MPQEKGYVHVLMVSVYTVPSLVVYTGTQNRPHIEWQSKGKDPIIHTLRVSTNTVAVEPGSLTMLAYQSSCVSFTRPLPSLPLPSPINPTLSQSVIQRCVLLLSFCPRPNWCVSGGILQHVMCDVSLAQAGTYLCWMPRQLDEISLLCNILALKNNVQLYAGLPPPLTFSNSAFCPLDILTYLAIILTKTQDNVHIT